MVFVDFYLPHISNVVCVRPGFLCLPCLCPTGSFYYFNSRSVYTLPWQSRGHSSLIDCLGFSFGFSLWLFALLTGFLWLEYTLRAYREIQCMSPSSLDICLICHRTRKDKNTQRPALTIYKDNREREREWTCNQITADGYFH